MSVSDEGILGWHGWNPPRGCSGLRHNFEGNGFTPTLALNTTYTVRVGMCLTIACDLGDVVFASERTATTPMQP